MDRNDELDKHLSDQIKESVIQYKNESNQRGNLVRSSKASIGKDVT